MRNTFKAKSADDQKWVYGSLIEHRYIVGKVIDWNEDYFNTEWWCEVIPETVGQFIDKEDMHKNKIFEGDILASKERDVIFQVVWDSEDCAFKFKSSYTDTLFEIDRSLRKLEIIGNIHDEVKNEH